MNTLELKSFNEAVPQAFRQLIEDGEMLDEALLDARPKIQQMLLESVDCYPRSRDAKIEDVITNAHIWQCLVDELRKNWKHEIECRAKEIAGIE